MPRAHEIHRSNSHNSRVCREVIPSSVQSASLSLEQRECRWHRIAPICRLDRGGGRAARQGRNCRICHTKMSGKKVANSKGQAYTACTEAAATPCAVRGAVLDAVPLAATGARLKQSLIARITEIVAAKTLSCVRDMLTQSLRMRCRSSDSTLM